MLSYTDHKVHCPFDHQHIIPLPSAPFHITKCKDKYLSQNPGKVVYHCRWNYMHIFLEKEKLQAHETALVCKKDCMGQTFETFVAKPKEVKRNATSSFDTR
jgi:hypothetical protein